MTELIHSDITDNVAFIKIDNPPVNALTIEATIQLKNAVNDLNADESLRAVIISATKYKNVFVAGADINKFLGLKTKEDGEELAGFYQPAFDGIADLPCPVICVVDGLALGGGCELALACDIRIAAENSQFALTEVKLGVIPGGGGTQRLARLVGPGYAKYMIYSGLRIDAREAFRIGLVEILTPEGEALKSAVSLVDKIRGNAPTAIKCAKRAINDGLDVPIKQGMEIEKRELGMATQSGEAREGAAAFLEKRQPAF